MTLDIPNTNGANTSPKKGAVKEPVKTPEQLAQEQAVAAQTVKDLAIAAKMRSAFGGSDISDEEIEQMISDRLAKKNAEANAKKDTERKEASVGLREVFNSSTHDLIALDGWVKKALAAFNPGTLLRDVLILTATPRKGREPKAEGAEASAPEPALTDENKAAIRRFALEAKTPFKTGDVVAAIGNISSKKTGVILMTMQEKGELTSTGERLAKTYLPASKK